MKRLLKELVGGKAPGPTPSFLTVHVIKALELIAEKPIGRNKLSKELSLGEGATRTLVERLREHGLILVGRRGCIFSKKGAKLWDNLHAVLPRKIVLGKSELTLGTFDVALIVKGYGSRVGVGMEQRDAALLIGAKGATTLIFKNGKLVIPPDDRDVAEAFPTVYRKLRRSLEPEEGDVIVVGSADNLRRAEYGALTAALSLLNNHNIIRK